MNKNIFRSSALTLFLLLIMPVVVFGQNTEALCRAFVNRAFGDMGSNCANLDSNEACYAYGNFGEVTSTFYVDGTTEIVQEDVFSEPSERTSLLNDDELETFESIVTQEFVLDRNNDRVDDNRLGIALLEVPANLPQQLDENSAVYILFSGARLENAVFPEEALILGEPVTVTTDGEINVFGAPADLDFAIASEPVGEANGELEADGISSDGDWVRVFFVYERDYGDRATAWVKVADLSESEGIDDLPVIGPNSFTPMQRFFLTNTFDLPACENIPAPGLLVQGPEAIETDFMVNNISMRVTSTVFLRQISATRFQITPLTGFAILFPDSDGEEVIPEGFTRVVCLSSEEESLGIDGLANDRQFDPTNCNETRRPLSRAELAGLVGFNNLPRNLLNYVFRIGSEICPSGIGNVQCVYVPGLTVVSDRIEARCEAGQLPDAVCERFGF